LQQRLDGEEKMSENVTLTIVEMFISLIVEGVIITMIFNWISNKSDEKQKQTLQQEMNNIEKQNKFDYEQIMNAINQSRLDIISQIKESSKTE
jgi:uncharacterized membrane-anchored protein YhcB (DUF1043 family)